MIKRFWHWLWQTSLFQTKLFQSNFTRQFIKFGIIGLSNTALSYALYLIFLFLFEENGFFPNYDYLICSVLTFCVCTVWSFYWNNKYVFTVEEGRKRNLFLALIKTYLSYAFTGILLTNVLSVLWVDIVGIPKEIAPIINLTISVPLNFLINKFWAFRTKKKEAPASTGLTEDELLGKESKV